MPLPKVRSSDYREAISALGDLEQALTNENGITLGEFRSAVKNLGTFLYFMEMAYDPIVFSVRKDLERLARGFNAVVGSSDHSKAHRIVKALRQHIEAQ